MITKSPSDGDQLNRNISENVPLDQRDLDKPAIVQQSEYQHVPYRDMSAQEGSSNFMKTTSKNNQLHTIPNEISGETLQDNKSASIGP